MVKVIASGNIVENEAGQHAEFGMDDGELPKCLLGETNGKRVFRHARNRIPAHENKPFSKHPTTKKSHWTSTFKRLKSPDIFMKSNQFAFILASLLLISTAVNAWLSCRFVGSAHKLRSLEQRELPAINSDRTLMAAILNEANEYGKKNPAILPILQMTAPQADAPNTGHPALEAPAAGKPLPK